MFTLENYKNGIKNIFGRRSMIHSESNACDQSVQLPVFFSDDEIEVSINELIENGYSFENFVLKCEKTYEFALDMFNRMRPFISTNRYVKDEKFKAIVDNYKFNITQPSNLYIIALVCFIGTQSADEDKPRFFSSYFSYATNDEWSIVDCYRFANLQIEIPKAVPSAEINALIKSYLFNISFNHGLLFKIVEENEERIRHIRNRREGQLFPFKLYKNELITYYNQGLTSDMPMAQYLAFYHVIEFFFASISEQDMVQKIKATITAPSFSPLRNRDIKDLFKLFKKINKVQKEDGVWDEKNALRLCLQAYVPDLDSLTKSLISIDSSLINYYSTTDVSFANEAKRIDFEEKADIVYNMIRDRVYSVRNAIVHSKEGEKLKYEPFKNDRELTKELPLIQAIAEEVIINSAKDSSL